MKKKRTRQIKAVLLSSALTAAIGLNAVTVFAEDGDTNTNTPPENSQGGTPPEKPDGDNGGTPPDKPDGSGNGGTPPDGAPGGGGGANTQSYDYTGTNTGRLTADGEEVSSSNETVSTDTADENAALSENGGTLTIDQDTLEKSGDDTNGDNCNFYGLNSISLTVGEDSKTVISNSTLNADSEGSNGIFSTDNGTVYANKDTIATTAGNSRGLDATYGGTIIANEMDISTQGDHSAAIATDRGGGNISVNNSTLSTAGSGSPLLYSTGNIQVNNTTGTSSGSQIAGMEGLNTILILNSSLTSTNTEKTASDPVADGVIIYQSTSGDAETTTGERARFQAVNSTLKSAISSGAMFYLTNTSADIILSGTTLDFDSDNAKLLYIAGNDSNNWGTAGSNGADVIFTGYGENLSGDITVDTISSLDCYFLDGTTYTGVTTIETNAVNTNTTEAPITVNISSDSTWIVTGNAEVTNLNVEDGGKIVDSEGKTVSIVVNGETVVEGDSEYTVTVNGTYGTSFTTSDDNAVSTDYIDRTDFDSTFSTSTAFDTISTTSTPSATAAAEETKTTETEESSNHTVVWVIGGIAVVAIAACIIIRKKQKH